MSPTIPSLQARWRVWRWILWLGLGALGVSWVWQTVLRQQAADELRAAGFVVSENKIWELARKDWHALFKLESWRARRSASYHPRDLRDGATPLRSLDAFVPALRRLHLVDLFFYKAEFENVDGLRQLPTLKHFRLMSCPKTENIDGLQGLAQLETVEIYYCPALQNVDGLKGLTQLKELNLQGCPALQNIDALKGLIALKRIMLVGCPELSAQSIAELRAALPKTNVMYAGKTGTSAPTPSGAPPGPNSP